MLVDHPSIMRPDPILSLIASVGQRSSQPTKLATGVYEIGHFGSSNWPSGTIDPNDALNAITCTNEEWEKNYIQDSGVCDNWEQILEHTPQLQDPNRKFCITLTPITKADEPQEGGWRWHKWGEYIGTKDPQHEYIRDEDDSIEKVYVYSIYEVK